MHVHVHMHMHMHMPVHMHMHILGYGPLSAPSNRVVGCRQ